ncbi:MAG: hypothetical protein PHE63_07440 [Eubacteriales bacterium]|nr:hypothetical protein [Eubacteriales bacterium]
MAIKASDQITIVDVTDAYSVILTSEAYTFVGGTGGVTSGASCSTQAVAYCGTNQCSKVGVTAASIICPSGISAAVTGSGTNAVTITFTTTATISTACEATIPVTVDGITVNKKFSFAVAKQGSTGNTGATGATGKGIKSTTITYQSGASGTTAPTGTWGSSIPTVSASQYLWTKTVITYTDNTTSTSYAVGMMGATGEKGNTGATGNGVKSTTITYQSGASGTTAPTGTWSSSIPTVSASQYLWTKTVITYTDNTTSTSYAVGMMGATGPKGNPGDAGKDAINVTISPSNGTVFKNSSGSTVLTAHVFKGGVEQSITDAGVCGSLGSIKWYKAGVSTPVATSKTITVEASGVDNVAPYSCNLED